MIRSRTVSDLLSISLYAIGGKKSRGMTIFLIILFIVLLVARILFGYFSEVVPFFASLLTALTWLTVGAGIFALVFIAAKLYREFKDKRE